MKGYPVFLIGLAQRRCIVIGGGAEAQRKVAGLLDCDAAVTVISKRLSVELGARVQLDTIQWIPRAYEPGDLRGAFLVISTLRDAAVNARIWQEANAERALINVEDDPPHCSFIAGSVMRRGLLAIALSTGGAAPALAVRLRERMQREFGPEYATFLEWMQALREPLAARYPDFEERRARWYALVDSDILELLRAGQLERARQRTSEIAGLGTSGTSNGA